MLFLLKRSFLSSTHDSKLGYGAREREKAYQVVDLSMYLHVFIFILYIYIYIYIYIYFFFFLVPLEHLPFVFSSIHCNVTDIFSLEKFYQLFFSYIISILFLLFNLLIGLVGGVFTNGLGDQGSISGRIITKTLKMVLDTSLLNTQQ